MHTEFIQKWFNQTEGQISLPYTLRVKHYRDHIQIRKYHQERTTLSPGYELSRPLKQAAQKAPEGGGLSSKARSLTRTKQTLTDLVLMNDFDMFATFTFNKNRHDINSCKLTMSNWLKSQQKTHGKFQYLIVPEYHKDKALHFHALLQHYTGNLSPAINPHSNKPLMTKSGLPIYNISSYRSGFSTITKIKNQEATSKYIRKYITKDMPEFSSKKRYWSSKNLNKPLTIYDIEDNYYDKIATHGNETYTNYIEII